MFTENVTVADHGPSTAFGVAINLFVPAGLIVTAARGATVTAGTLDWIDPTLAVGASTTHPVTFTVAATTHGTATIGGVAEGDGPDPNPANNAAITTVHLG